MTPEQIRAAYATVIGDHACDQLATAGLLPTVEERQWWLDDDHRVTTDTRDTVPYIRQQRYATAWTDLSE